jgi:hypothetical protein
MENGKSIGLYYAGYMFLLGALGAIFGLFFAIFVSLSGETLFLSILFFTIAGGGIGIGCGLLKHAKLLENDGATARKK